MKKETLKKYLTIAFFTGAFILLVFLIQTYGIEPLRSAVKEMGIWAPLGILILRGISVILPALPSSVYSLLAGSLLGFKTGYLTIFISDLIFCQLAFFIARNFGRAPVRKLVGVKAMKRIEGFNQNQLEGNFFLMTGLLMTGLFDFLSYALGIGGNTMEAFHAGSNNQFITKRFNYSCCWRRSKAGRRTNARGSFTWNVCISNHRWI